MLSFLQTRQPPVLPALQRAESLDPQLLNGVNVAFDRDLSKYQDFGKANTSTLGDLLFQFFRYYGHELDFEASVVSVRLGEVIPKSQKGWHRLQDNRLCVEEPFNIVRNLANTADDTSMRGIHLELRRAFDLVARGRLDECCEQYIAPQPELAPRRTDTFIAPITKAIIPQPPPQIQPVPSRSGAKGYKSSRRGERQNNGGRRASNPVPRPANHLHDLPFAMTPQELQLQQQHQQHLLHDQLFQQYQYLQLQEQELRWQLYRHRGLTNGAGFSSTDSTDDGQEPPSSSRSSVSSRMPQTAPLYQSRFNHGAMQMGNIMNSSGIVTNPGSPLLPNVVPDSRRYTRRASINNAAANTLRAHSQPARSMPVQNIHPHLTQRIDVPVRQVDPTQSRRSPANSVASDPLHAYLQQRLLQQGTRYDAGRRPVEYVGYYVGQSPSLSARPGSATISPIPPSAGLAIHNGGLSPRMSTRSSRIPSVSTSPASHYATLANGHTIMTPVTEQVPEMPDLSETSPRSVRTGPLIVDGSVNSPPRRQPNVRSIRTASEELDISVTTSEDAPLDTPSSTDDMSSNGHVRPTILQEVENKPSNGDILQERDYLSLNGASTAFGEPLTYGEGDATSMLQSISDERSIQQLTNALTAATTTHNVPNTNDVSRREPSSSSSAPPLLPIVNGNHISTAGPALNGGHEWQIQSKKKNKKRKGPKHESHEKGVVETGRETPPQDESLRKGG